MIKLNILLGNPWLTRVGDRSPSFWRRVGACFVLLGVGLALTAIARKSVTVDEFQALPSGLAVLRTGDLRYPQGTPPLSQILPALSLVFSDARIRPVEGRNANWAVAHQFAEDNADQFHFYFFVGRLVSAFVLAITLALTYGLACSLYGERGGALAAFCAALNPTLLAHGALLTPDIYFAASVMLFLVALDRFVRRNTFPSALALGGSVGLTCLMKFTGIGFALLAPLVSLLMLKKPGTGMKKFFAMGGLALAAALFVIHAGYFFREPIWLLGSFEPESTPMQVAVRALPSWLPIFLPAQFVRALDGQLGEAPYIAYLFGQSNIQGFFSYYLVAFLVKTPVPLLVLPILAWFWDPRVRAREWGIVAVAVAFFCFFSAARYKNLGLRYLLFLYPVISVWVGRLGGGGLSRKWPRVLAIGACLLLPWSVALSWPDYIAYFNLPSGGPDTGHRYLLDSNLDWGQDLTSLKEYMTEKNIESLDLAHFGHVSPALYGIKFSTLNGPATHRFVAISANFLWGRSYFVNGTMFYPEHLLSYTPYRSWTPVAVLGHSIYVYDMAHLGDR